MHTSFSRRKRHLSVPKKLRSPWWAQASWPTTFLICCTRNIVLLVRHSWAIIFGDTINFARFRVTWHRTHPSVWPAAFLELCEDNELGTALEMLSAVHVNAFDAKSHEISWKEHGGISLILFCIIHFSYIQFFSFIYDYIRIIQFSDETFYFLVPVKIVSTKFHCSIWNWLP